MHKQDCEVTRVCGTDGHRRNVRLEFDLVTDQTTDSTTREHRGFLIMSVVYQPFIVI